MLTKLINIIATLPSLGPRSARRIALHLITNKSNMLLHLSQTLKEVHETVKFCHLCNNIDITSPCRICSDASRDKTKICVVETVDDIFQIENSRHYRGLYHIIGKPDEHLSPTNLDVPSLIRRIEDKSVTEVILANSPTLGGQTAMFYISETIESCNTTKNSELHVTVLGRGLPIGSEIDYLDEGTIHAAFESRKTFKDTKD